MGQNLPNFCGKLVEGNLKCLTQVETCYGKGTPPPHSAEKVAQGIQK
jgi:hypothetical protein